MKNNNLIIGSWLNSGSTTIAEIMSQSGLDFVTIDMEHSPVGIEGLSELLRAIRSGSPNCKALVRSYGSDYQDIKRYMDLGADGVIVPFVNTANTAQMVVNAVKYPPMGIRGVGYARDNRYGVNISSRIKSANDSTFVCIQIEHIDAFNNIEEILSVKGIDAAFIGPYDLSSSMGDPGNFKSQKFTKLLKLFLDACEKYQIIPGIHIVQPDMEELERRIKEGFGMLAYSLDITLVSTLLAEINKKLNRV
jgi:2-dehydro-3-deoxyglucarate aldolase